MDWRKRVGGITWGWLSLLVGLSACVDAPADKNQASPVTGLRVSSVLGEVTDSGYARAEHPRPFVFPEDHYAHSGFRSEWWYLTATLKDKHGLEYGVQFTLFRQALTPQPPGEGPWQTGLAYLGHVAITDVAARRHQEAQRFARGHPALAGVRREPDLSVYIDDWTLQQQPQSEGEGLALRLQAQHHGGQQERFALDLELVQQQAIVLQGDAGLSRKSQTSASYYYSMPRLSVQGTLQLQDKSVAVSGLAWLDREWSTSVLPAEVAGWDWFALHLNDGRSIMAFRLRRHDGQRDPFDHGLLMAADVPAAGVIDSTHPSVQLLTPSDYTLQPRRFWQDKQGATWPVSWTLTIGDEVIHIDALVDDQVMNTAIVYWEGIVAARDAQGNNLGRGYMELTGYQTPTGEDK